MSTNKIRAIIVDDEHLARENLRFMLEDFCPEIELIGTADSVDSAEQLFKSTRPDLVFLDIRMPSGSEGFELIKRLSAYRYFVVFVTAFKEYAIEAFESRALHYILKPIDEEDLIETVRRIQPSSLTEAYSEQLERYTTNLRKIESDIAKAANTSRISIAHSKGIKLVETNNILYLEGSGNCSILHFKDGNQYLDTRSLKTYEGLLPNWFFRVHKSYLVNLYEVEEVLHTDGLGITIKSGTLLPLSRDRKKDLLVSLSDLR